MGAGPTSMCRAYGVVLLAFSVAACGGNPRPARLGATVPHPDSGTNDSRTIVHLLNRTTFGPRPGDVERVLATGVSAYIDEQLHPERISDQLVQPRLAALTPPTNSGGAYARE